MKYKIRILLTKQVTCLSSDFVKPSAVSKFSKSWLRHVSKVSSRGMMAKSESTSKLPILNVESCSLIFWANWKESLILHKFLVKVFNVGTKN